MRKLAYMIAFAVLAGACSDATTPADDAGTTTTTDASVDGSPPPVPTSTPDAATPPPDASTPDAAPPTADDYYALGAARTTPQIVECRPGAAYVVSGRAANRTSLTYYFQAMPAAGTYTVEMVPTGTPPNLVPTSPTGVLARYASDPQGGTSERHDATSGTVTVTVVGGKVRAVGAGLPSKEGTSGATGTIAGQLTCP